MKNIVIRASAGAGKTFALSNRFIELLVNGEPPDTILASTFTRKAAGEIRDRILYRLAEGSCSEELAKNLANELGQTDLTHDDLRRALRTAADSLHRLRMSTLDSYFHKLCLSFRYELGIPSQPRIMDEGKPEIKELRNVALEKLLVEEEKKYREQLLHEFHDGAARRDVTDQIHKILDRLYNVYRESHDEAWDKIENPGTRLEPAELKVIADSLRNACAELPEKRQCTAIEKEAVLIELEKWDELQRAGIMKKVLNGEEEFYRKPIPENVLALYRRAVEHFTWVEMDQLIKKNRANFDLIVRFDREYQQLQSAAKILLFSDFAYKISRGLIGDSDLIGQMDYRLDTSTNHLLLDEFQDTSTTQWEALRPLAERIVHQSSEEKKKGSFFCVGDVKQAIYGWRGGCPQIFDQISEELGVPDETIAENWRSSQTILDVVNLVFTDIGESPAVSDMKEAALTWQNRFEDHTAKRSLPGYVEILTAPSPREEEDSDDEEDQETADPLWLITANKAADLTANYPNAEIGILVTRNKFIPPLIRLLDRRGIRASGEGGKPLTDDPGVQVVLAAMKMADHPGDTIASFHVYHSSLRGPLKLESLEPAVVARASRELRAALLDKGYSEVVTDLVRRVSPHCDRSTASKLQRLIEIADSFESGPSGARAGDFIRQVESVNVEEPSEAKVRIMTVDKSKGLEFDIVILPDLDKLMGTPEDGVHVLRSRPGGPIEAVVPSSNALQRKLSEQLAKAHEQEVARRLDDDLSKLYVAMTRPRYALYAVLKPISLTAKGELSTKGWTNKTWATILRRKLSTLQESESPDGDEKLYDYGDPDWYEKSDLAKAAAPAQAAPIREKRGFVRIDFRDQSGRPSRSWTKVSPSGLADNAQVSVRDLLTRSQNAATVRGLIVHRWFEEIEWLEDFDLSPAVREYLEHLAKEISPQLTPDEFETHYADFQEMLNRENVRRALTREDSLQRNESEDPGSASASLTVWRERKFAAHIDDRMISGIFDRVVISRSTDGEITQAVLYDWKTGSRESSPSEAEEKYQPQMNAYANVLRKILKTDNVETKLIFVDRT